MADLATIADFEARHGPVELAQGSIVSTLLSDASGLILDEVPDSVAGWVLGTDLPPAAIVRVCVEVAYRAWRNPDALSTVVLGSLTRSYRASDPDAFWLTDQERRTVRRSAKRSTMRSVTLVSPYSGDITNPLA